MALAATWHKWLMQAVLAGPVQRQGLDTNKKLFGILYSGPLLVGTMKSS